MRLSLAVLVVLSVTCNAAEPKTHPKTILLIRHAEKPASEDDIHLSPEGVKRAEALPKLFDKSFPKPGFIFATKASKHSNRPVETVTPLAKMLNLDINAKFEDDEYPKLAAELFTNPKYEGKTVLICWHHGKLPELASALGATDVPDKWKDSVFDRVWVVTFENGKAKLSKRHQELLPGDSKE